MAVKAKEIAKKNGFNAEEFEHFLLMNLDRIPGINESLFGVTISEYAVDKAVEQYREKYCLTEEEKQQRALEKEEELKRQAEKQEALANMLITSGFSFDGYKITKYSGYISGDDAISIGRGTDGIFSSATNVGESLTNSLVRIRRQAIKELKEAAYDLGCNAVIGVDFDYITLEPETANSQGGTTYLPYVFCVTANGNAVVIEKIED